MEPVCVLKDFVPVKVLGGRFSDRGMSPVVNYLGRPLGSAFFQAVCAQVPGLVLEVEDPAFSLDEQDRVKRERRIAFYQRNGCRMTQLKASMLMGLESSSASSEVLARQMLVFNRVLSIDEMVSRIEKITPKDILETAGRIFSSRPTYTLVGDIDGHADFDQLQQMLK